MGVRCLAQFRTTLTIVWSGFVMPSIRRVRFPLCVCLRGCSQARSPRSFAICVSRRPVPQYPCKLRIRSEDAAPVDDAISFFEGSHPFANCCHRTGGLLPRNEWKKLPGWRLFKKDWIQGHDTFALFYTQFPHARDASTQRALLSRSATQPGSRPTLISRAPPRPDVTWLGLTRNSAFPLIMRA